jgi:hypothetical protein
MVSRSGFRAWKCQELLRSVTAIARGAQASHQGAILVRNAMELATRICPEAGASLGGWRQPAEAVTHAVS